VLGRQPLEQPGDPVAVAMPVGGQSYGDPRTQASGASYRETFDQRGTSRTNASWTMSSASAREPVSNEITPTSRGCCTE
jgi:hypothetical protein